MKLTHWLEPGDTLTAPLTSIKKEFTLSPWSEVTLFRSSTSCNNINGIKLKYDENFISFPYGKYTDKKNWSAKGAEGGGSLKKCIEQP